MKVSRVFRSSHLMNYYFIPMKLSTDLIITSHNNFNSKLARSVVDYLSENVNSICCHQAKIALGEAFFENYVKISVVAVAFGLISLRGDDKIRISRSNDHFVSAQLICRSGEQTRLEQSFDGFNCASDEKCRRILITKGEVTSRDFSRTSLEGT